MIFLLDDLHWSDSGSLDFLAYLWQRSRQQPLFILGLARPTLLEQDTPWGRLIQAQARIDLQPLALQESRSLVDQILQHVDQIPPTLYERIDSSAEGNPFYMEELIKIMIDRQVILTHTMPWQIDAQRLEGLPIPPTLSGVLQARLDGLAEGERQTLQKAAVVGRIFWDQALSFMSTASPQVMDAFEAQLLAQIEALAQRGLIFSHPASAFAGAEEYAFKHILLQEVTYETLLKKQRPLYHALAAEWLVDACGDRANEYAARIAEHWNKAGKTALAAEWYGRAADHARKNHALETAITYYRKALANPGLLSTDQTIHFYKGLGAALSSRSLYAEALKVYAALQALAQAGGDSLTQAQMLKNIAWLQERQGNISASLAYLEQALALLQTLPGDRAVRAEQAVILARKGWGLCHQGDARGALACGEGALALVAGESDPESLDARARGYNTLGTAHQMLGHFSEALHCRQQSLELHRALNNQRSVGTSLNNLGEIARMQGDYASAVEYYRMALKITQETGDLGGEMIRLSNLGGAQVGLGEYAAAERSLLLVIEKAGKTRQVVLVEAYCFLAEAYLGQGRGDEALAAVRTALELGQSLGNKTVLGEVWRTMGNCGLLVADLGADPSASPAELPASGALSPAFCFARSIEIFGETGAQHEQARTLRAWARYDLQRGDPSQGAQHWEAARAMFEALGMMLEVERMVLDF